MLAILLVWTEIARLRYGMNGLVFPLDAKLHLSKAHLGRAFILVDPHLLHLLFIVDGFSRHAFFSGAIGYHWLA